MFSAESSLHTYSVNEERYLLVLVCRDRESATFETFAKMANGALGRCGEAFTRLG